MSEFPQAVERFEVERVLGQGGMGTVYLARDARLGRQVAVKVLHDKDLSNDEKRARFLREARTAAAIRHPNVATIYEVGETDEGAPFIVMEYCLGETLAQRVRRRPIEAGEFLVIARQLAAGLSAAHEAGIIHRDLKTANVIVEPTGAAKILDFGLAKPVRRELDKTVTLDSSSGRFFGTLHFLSPEQARGLPADARSDLFALGVVLYQMATGHLPFNADAPLLVLDKIRDDEPEPFVPLDPAFPTTAARIIGRLLQKQPEQRYQTAKELLEDLQQIDSPTARFNASVTHHTRSALGRTIARPRWIRVAIIIVAAAVLGTAIWFARNAQRLPVTPEAPPAAPEPIKSMAVMPLQNIANSTRDDFLSVGLADALTTKLQSIPSLQVRPTSAVLEFRNHKVDTKDASSKLHVDSLLEGHFLAAGNLVRVNLQLTDARTGYSVWADSIDGRREDLLKLIDDVSSRTVAGLNQKLGVQQQPLRGSEPRSSSPKAFEEYLKARALGNSLVPAEHAQQVTYLKRAIDLDPKFAAAYADLAIVLSLGQTRGLETDPQTALHAERYARQAVRLDPNLAGAHLALGRTLVKFNDRFREATRENLAALRLNARDAQSIWTIGSFFVSTGDMVQAQCISDYLVRLDPDSNEAKTRGYWYVNAVDAEDALKVAPDALASRDSELAGHDIRGSAFLLQGDLAQAQKESAAVKALVPHHYLGRSLDAMIAAASGDRAAAGAALAALEPDAQRNHWAAMRAALSYAKLGERDKAIFWMKHSAELGNHSWYAWIRHPWLQPLQADPEFQQIAGQIRADLDDVRDDVMGVYGLICK